MKRRSPALDVDKMNKTGVKSEKDFDTGPVRKYNARTRGKNRDGSGDQSTRHAALR